MILSDLKKTTFIIPESSEDWFVGVGYLTTAILVMAAWLYVLVLLATRIFGWV